MSTEKKFSTHNENKRGFDPQSSVTWLLQQIDSIGAQYIDIARLVFTHSRWYMS